MGIPAYFSHIIKNHNKTLSTIDSNFIVHNLYLDSNSIIYDSLYACKDIKNNFEKELIKTICQKLHIYIDQIKPTITTYIAFDGVAPVAKLEQQRVRRMRSEFISKIESSLNNKKPENNWDRTAITPGTEFMENLGNEITSYFKNAKKFNLQNIIVSTSSEPGEGEHKLFEYIRNNPVKHSNENTIVYGLDADLIMLSINHLPVCPNIYLFRETPEFIKQIDSSLDPNKLYKLNIPLLANEMILELNNYQTIDEEYKKNKIYDYIFLCFFLGNDFMPHIPCINIRTKGINILMNAYSELFSNNKLNLTDGKKIYWKNVRKLINYLSDNEKEYYADEYKHREKMERRKYKSTTTEEKLIKFNSIPTINRNIEKYIDPSSDGWEERYYDKLFHVEYTEDRVKQICHNYLEALEWTFKYYIDGCPNWRWKYNYHYAPLMKDLAKHIPYFDEHYFNKSTIGKPIHPYIQLSYVLPKNSHKLLPKRIQNIINSNTNIDYNFDFEWAFCTYFWENHIISDYINIDTLENIICIQ